MEQKKIAKIFVLTDLLLQELEVENKVPTKETKVIKDKCNDLINVLEPVLNRFYNNKEVSKSIFFITLQNKFNYIFNKEYR
jgi:hypothetical protein